MQKLPSLMEKQQKLEKICGRFLQMIC